MLTSADWQKFYEVMNMAGDSFMNKTVNLRFYRSYVAPYMEDPLKVYFDIPLKVLCNYNYMRSWPISQETESGEIDRQSIQLLFLKRDLVLKGLITPSFPYPKYNPDINKFIIDGQVYAPMGDTFVSQAGSEDILFSIIVKRYLTETGNPNIVLNPGSGGSSGGGTTGNIEGVDSGDLTLTSPITFNGGSPVGIDTNTYRFFSFGPLVILNITLSYPNQGGFIDSVEFDLPNTCPTPKIPVGLNSPNTLIYPLEGIYGPNTIWKGGLKTNTDNSWFKISANTMNSSFDNFKQASFIITYWKV